ncbi:MAG: hypothetical protein KG075_07460 [Alphaproteobacteria bacterium]|nr:hypothetical protein [Alphaproteobacteria bacterium]
MSILRLIADSSQDDKPRAELAEALVAQYSKETLAYAAAFLAEQTAGFRRMIRPGHDAKAEIKQMRKMLDALEGLGRQMRAGAGRRKPS